MNNNAYEMLGLSNRQQLLLERQAELLPMIAAILVASGERGSLEPMDVLTGIFLRVSSPGTYLSGSSLPAGYVASSTRNYVADKARKHHRHKVACQEYVLRASPVETLVAGVNIDRVNWPALSDSIVGTGLEANIARLLVDSVHVLSVMPSQREIARQLDVDQSTVSRSMPCALRLLRRGIEQQGL